MKLPRVFVSLRLRAMSSAIKIDPEIMSGAACFAGTRVPIQNIIDYLEGGDAIDEFLEDFPSVGGGIAAPSAGSARGTSGSSEGGEVIRRLAESWPQDLR